MGRVVSKRVWYEGVLIPRNATFDEWKKLGFHVNKGEKSTQRNELGLATFNYLQVSENIYEFPDDMDDYIDRFDSD